MWNPYLAEDMVVTLIIGKSAIDLWTSVVPLIFFKLVELHCPDRVMRQFDFKQHISSNLDTRDQLHFISRLGRHADYNWMTHHLHHISMRDVRRNFIFRELHLLIFKEEYMDSYLSISHQIITPNLAQVPPHEEMEYVPLARRIQNAISICYFL
jgi:hypothetical protein